jgi:hypothetical protein
MIASIVIGATSAVDCRLCGASLSNQQILAYKLRRYIFWIATLNQFVFARGQSLFHGADR